MKLGLCPPEPTAGEGGQSGRQSSVGAELKPGEVLDGRFAILDVISRGGMATIYKANDLEKHGELVAVKVPIEEVEMNPAFFARFQREEEIGVRLSHPYVLRFVPVGREKSRPYLVTEYVRGCTLFDLLRDFRLLPEPDALAIASLICEALDYLHAEGVIHRDLKPENVMICFDGTIRIMDFGIACGANSRRITYIGFAPGTPHYMAPERVNRKRGDGRTDIYSLGAMLYEMLTGVIAFTHDDSGVIMEARVTGDPEPLRKLNPKISPQAEEIVLRAMERNPEQRYPTAAAMKADLDAPAEVAVTGRWERLEASTPRKRRLRQIRSVVLWAVVPVAVQILLFLALWRYLAAK